MSWKYTDQSNRVANRVLPNGAIESCLVSSLAPGAVVLEADPPEAPSPLSQIEALERESRIPRLLREFMLETMEREAVKEGALQGLTAEQAVLALRNSHDNYRTVKELDEQIGALRALL